MNQSAKTVLAAAVVPATVLVSAGDQKETWRSWQGTEKVYQLSAKNSYDRKYLRRQEIDFKRFPVVVIESDDWGLSSSTMEKVEELETLFKILESARGVNGLPSICTAFTCVGNPDFERIEKSNFTWYYDIALDKGVPKPYKADGIVEKMREGIKRGVWRPEYHALIHHVSPRLWLQLLRGEGKAADIARERFKKSIYTQPSHLPEYEGFTVKEQNDIIRLGLARFKRMFGYDARAAVTSDAYPETVVLWAAQGIEVVALINAQNHNDVVTVYHTKPWNFQDMYAKAGDFGASTGVAYLPRNASFEKNYMAKDTFAAIQRRWASKVPAVINCHRPNLLLPARVKEFKKLLKYITEAGGILITSAELRDLYHQGWFVRSNVLHKYAAVPCPYEKGVDIATGKEINITPRSTGHFRIK